MFEQTGPDQKMKMFAAGMKVRFFLIALITPLFATNVSINAMSQSSTRLSPDFEFCAFDLNDREDVEEIISAAFPKGSSVDELESEFRARSASKVHRYGVLGTEWIGLSIYAECSGVGREGEKWHVHTIADKAGAIDDLEVKLTFTSEAFLKRNIDFRIELFESSRELEIALWAMTGVGAQKQEVNAVMIQAGLEPRKSMQLEDRLVVQYRQNKDPKSLIYRLGNPGNLNLLFYFDNKEGLTRISVG